MDFYTLTSRPNEWHRHTAFLLFKPFDFQYIVKQCIFELGLGSKNGSGAKLGGRLRLGLGSESGAGLVSKNQSGAEVER